MKMSENQLLMVQKKQVVIQKGKKVACNGNVDFYVIWNNQHDKLEYTEQRDEVDKHFEYYHLFTFKSWNQFG